MAGPLWDDHKLAYQLEDASYYGHDAEVLDLLSRGADPNYYHPLHWACFCNYPHTAVTLIQWGADLRMRDGDGQTPLHYACDSSSMACVKVCLEHHSPTDIKDDKFRTPVDLARERKHDEVADYITNYKPLAKGPLSEYPSIKQLSKFQLRKWFKLGLHFNIPKHQMEGIRKHQHPTTKTLLAARVKNMELKWKDIVEGLLRIGEDRRWMETALIVSIHLGMLDLLRYLVDTQGITLTATVHIEGLDVCTLSYTCSRGYTDVTKYLVMEKKIYDILEDRRWMETVLSLSVENGLLDLLQYLVDTVGVKLTATVHIKGLVECTLYYVCSRRYKYSDVTEYLKKKKPFVNDSLLHALKCGHLLEATFLLAECHADPNVTDSEGNTPLSLAKNPEVTKLLLKYGAKADNVYETHNKHIGELSSMRPPDNPLPIFITGDGGVGKSTFLKSMLSASTGLIAFFLKSKRVTGVDEKTVGIIPYDIDTKEFGRVICFDFAGQQEFYASHCAVLENAVQTSPPIIIYLADLQEENEQKTIDSIARWMTLVQNQCTNLRDKAHVIVVGSRADILKKRKQDPWSREGIFAPILNNFTSLEFISFIPMDCRCPNTAQMKEVKKIIQKSSAILRSPETVSLNAHTFYIYLLDSFKDELAVSLNGVHQRIHKDLNQKQSKHTKDLLSFIPGTLSCLVEICQQLSKRNLILYLHNEDSPEGSFIICDRTTLLSNVTGTVFAPENFRQHCKLASSTGVVPLSKFSEQFVEYSIEMLIAFMSHLELCFEIKDKEVLEKVREHEENPEPDVRYLFFLGLIRIDTPDKTWEVNADMSCHFVWIVECSQDIQFFDPRCLQVLILRLVFTFNLAPARKVQAHIPSLQRFCSVWKNGIFWCDNFGVTSHLELSDNGKYFVLKMSSRVLKPEFLMVRSKIITKTLETVRDFCPNVTTVESVIDPHELIDHPLKPAASLTVCTVTNIAIAVSNNLEDVKCEHQPLTMSQLLQFEPYSGLDQDTLQSIFSEKNAKKDIRISSGFIDYFATQIADSEHIKLYAKILGHHRSPIARVSQSDSSKQELVHTLETWRDKTEGTYSCLRETLNKYSIFTGRNPLDLAGVAHSDCDPSIFPEPPPPKNVHQDLGPDQLIPLSEVKEATKELQSEWYSMAVELEISHSVRKAIESNHSTVKARCTAMLQYWVMRASPAPSWSTLVRALRSPAINRGDIADKVEAVSEATSQSLSDKVSSTPPELDPLDPLSVDEHLKMTREALWEIRANWRDLGTELGITMGTLEVIEFDFQNKSNLCFTEMLEHWLTQTPPPTLNDLIKALNSPTIGHGDIASNLLKLSGCK